MLVQAGNYQLDESPRAILLISEKSSGSTIFQNEMARHPQVMLIEHTEHNEHETQYWLKAACLLEMPADDFLNHEPPMRRPTARKKLVDLIGTNVPDFRMPDNDEQLVSDGWRALCSRFRPVFFEKTPHHIQHWAALSLILRYMQSADHDVRIVGLVRNPLAMIHSAWSRWNANLEERQFVWKQSYQNLLRLREALTPEQLLIIRYEDMVSDPASTMRDVCQFADLRCSDAIGSHIHRRSLDTWRVNPTFTLQLDESVAAVAREFGYTDADMENRPKPSGLSGILLSLHWTWSTKWRRLNDKVGRRLRR